MGKSGTWWRGAPKNKTPRSGDIPDTIRDWELDKGGWRYGEDNTGYNLTWEQLLEFERTSMKILDDEEFNQWFKDFRKEHGITSRSYAGSYSGGYSSSSWDDDEWQDGEKKKKGKWLSSWWASDVYKGFKGTSDVATRLALVLQAVRTTIRAVDDTVPPLTVKWDDGGEQSFTDFGGKIIAINPAPITGKDKMEDGEAIDVTTGFALHEASHSQYSREPYETIVKPTELSPMQIAGMLLNFVEDIRIESLTTEKYPGFAGYFERSLAWAWGKSQKNLPKAWGPDLWTKMNAILVMIRFPEGPAALTDKSFAAETPWWINWRDEYLAGKVDARTTIQRGIDRLAEDPKTKTELGEMAKAEEEMKEALKNLKEVFEKLMKEGMSKMGIKPCIGDVSSEKLDDESAEEVEKLVGEKLQVEKVHIRMSRGAGNHQVFITHPQETAESKRAFIGKPKPVLSRLRAALLFRQELPRYTTRLLKRGNLDDEELWRWADKDYRVFNEEVIQSRPQTQLTFLVDMSGSMYGSKLHTAQELSQLFIWALAPMEGVTTKVYGHSGDAHNSGGSIDIYRLWEPGEPMSRLGLIHTLDHGNNYDGHAIAYCAKEILQRGQPDEQRVIIVLSDGYPSGIGYGGSEGMEHVREVVRWAEHQGVDVIQIAIDPAMDASRQARMFKHFLPFTSLDEVPKQLTRLLSKIV
jgi:hypothetical protein